MFPLATPTRASPMDSLRQAHHSLNLSLNPHRPSFSTSLSPSSSLSFTPLPPPQQQFRPYTTSFKPSSIRASTSHSQNDPAFRKPNQNDSFLSRLIQTLNPILSPAVETTCIVIAATAFFFMRFHHNSVIAAPLTATTATVDSSSTTATEDTDAPNEEKEREVEALLSKNPNDTEALRTLMELKIRARKIQEAIQVLERLIELEPEEFEWPLLKAHMYVYSDETENARNVFEEILKKDPLRVEAYHGLAMATSESKETMKGLLKRIEDATEQCKKQNKSSEVRDFRLLIAQIKVMEGDLNEALKAYQDLVKEEPRDFRPYLCQGIIYTMLRKKDEAEKQFEKFRKLVPKNHPYKEYFEENMFATKFFSQKLEREGAGARS